MVNPGLQNTLARSAVCDLKQPVINGGSHGSKMWAFKNASTYRLKIPVTDPLCTREYIYIVFQNFLMGRGFAFGQSVTVHTFVIINISL